jgi:hypothetical protein
MVEPLLLAGRKKMPVAPKNIATLLPGNYSQQRRGDAFRSI